MGVTLTDVLLFGKAQYDDIDNATLVIYRRNILRWSALGGYLDVIVKGVAPLSLPDAIADSLSYVKAFGGTEQRNLPVDYIELESLTSAAGTGAYINTGVKAASTVKIEVVVDRPEPPATGTSWYPFGAINDGTNGQIACFESTNSAQQKYIALTYGKIAYSEVASAVGSMTKSTLVLDGGVLTYDNGASTVTSPQAGQTFTTTNDIWLCARENVSVSSLGSVTIYSAKLWNDGVMVRNLVCAKRKSDGVLGMFDTVTQTFIACVGVFYEGKEINNIPAEYVENQFVYMLDDSYLLTNIIPTSDMRIEADVSLLSTVSGSVFGTRNSGGIDDGFYFAVISGNYFVIDGFSVRHQSAQTASANTRYKFVWDNNIGSVYQGSTLVDSHTFTPTQTMTYPMVINGINNAGAVPTSTRGMYFYGLKVWNAQGELIADYVPATLLHPLTVGIYDRVSGTHLLPTSGTWSAGPAVQNTVTPTPTNPIDIWCNNGILKARHQSGLPLGYTLLESATGYANQSVIDSGVAGNNNNLRIVFKGYKDNNTGYTPLFANYVDESSNVTRIIAGSSGGQVIFNLNRKAGSSDNLNDCSISDLHTYELYKTAAGVTTIKVDGVIAGTSNDSQGTANATNISIGNSRVLTQEPSTLSSTYWYFYFCKIYDDGVLIRDYVPVKRNSDNVVGIYDLVNNTFDAGQYPSFAPFSAGNVASDPVEVYTDGTVETIEDTIGNTATAEMLLKVGNYQDEQEIISGAVTRNIEVKVFDGTENWGASSTYQGSCWLNLSTASQAGICVCSHFANVPSTSTYARYKVLNEGFAINFWYGDNRTTAVADLKTFLAQQYAAGTPVILLRALTTSTTESVAGQTLQVTDGDNVLEITQASLNGLELEAQYQASVSLTIQEVQDANLDPNVEVTIN